MCIQLPVRFHSKKPIIAYKEMRRWDKKSPTIVQSLVAGNIYEIGKEYDAEEPANGFLDPKLPIHFVGVVPCPEYSKGFHAYAEIKKKPYGDRIIVRVELSDLTFRGVEDSPEEVVLVANKCKFLEVVE